MLNCWVPTAIIIDRSGGTCEDWNGVEYLSNVVVTATPSV